MGKKDATIRIVWLINDKLFSCSFSAPLYGCTWSLLYLALLS